MNRFTTFLISFALSGSALARPSRAVELRDINICSFISNVAINATGASDSINILVVSLDNNWEDITDSRSLYPRNPGRRD